MKLQIGFDEISAYIKGTYQKEVTFSSDSPKKISVKAPIKIIFTKMMTLSFEVVKVENNELMLALDGNFATQKAVELLLPILKKGMQDFETAVQYYGDNVYGIKLDKFQKLESTFKYLTFDDLSFTESEVDVRAHLIVDKPAGSDIEKC